MAAEDGGGTGGYIYTSSNSGYYWQKQETSGPNNWKTVASSGNGTILFAAEGGGGLIYRSTDSGLSWENSNITSPDNSITLGSYTGVACSSDGKKAGAVANLAKPIYYSDTDGYQESAAASSGPWSDISSSSDGSVMFATMLQDGQNPSRVYKSTNSGETWNKLGGEIGDWRSITCNNDCSKAIAAKNGGPLFIIEGSTFSECSSAGSRNWISVATSSDFTSSLAVEYGGYIWSRSNSGSDWTSVENAGKRSWSAVTTSANGFMGAAVVADGQIYTNFDCSQGKYMSGDGECKPCPSNSNSTGDTYTCTCFSCSTGYTGTGDSLECNACPGPVDDDDTGEHDVGTVVGVLLGAFIIFLIILYCVWKYLIHKNAQKEGLNELLYKDSMHMENPIQMEAQNDERRSEKR